MVCKNKTKIKKYIMRQLDQGKLGGQMSLPYGSLLGAASDRHAMPDRKCAY